MQPVKQTANFLFSMKDFLCNGFAARCEAVAVPRRKQSLLSLGWAPYGAQPQC